MDDETADIQRRIAEAKGVQARLTELQDQIRQQHDQLDSAIREVSEGFAGSSDQLRPATKLRDLRHGHSRD